MEHVDFQACKEHEIQQTHLAENGERRIIVQNIEAVRPYHHTGYNHADDVRNLQPVEKHGRKQDYGQHNQEDLYRLRHQCLPRGYHRPLCSRM